MTSTTYEPSQATDAAGSPKSIKSTGSRAGTRSPRSPPRASEHGSPAGAAGADDAVEAEEAHPEVDVPQNHFDFIHARTLAGAVQNWPALIHQCYEHVKPGGSIEISEGRANFFCGDDTLKGDSATWQWLSEFRKLSAPLVFGIAPALPHMLNGEGFENVNYMHRVVPMGISPKDGELKEIGRWFRVLFLEMALEAYTFALFTRAGNWKNEEVQVLLALVREELKSDKLHLYTST
ncbi:Secondary metabolism regulator LAE1 [Colletotrichum tropicale]|nr:Secondary metabolism regulator LAE1 [Colletotrichum tropicale]